MKIYQLLTDNALTGKLSLKSYALNVLHTFRDRDVKRVVSEQKNEKKAIFVGAVMGLRHLSFLSWAR